MERSTSRLEKRRAFTLLTGFHGRPDDRLLEVSTVIHIDTNGSSLSDVALDDFALVEGTCSQVRKLLFPLTDQCNSRIQIQG